MARSLRLAFVLALLGGVVLGTGVVDAGRGRHEVHARKIIDVRLAGIPASAAGQTLFGVVGGGAPWSLVKGRAKLFSNGRLELDVKGLVLAAGGSIGTNPIPTGQAILSCGGTVAAMSAAVPFSTKGDARVREKLTLPASCLGPVIFFAGITANGPRWFAISGW
jgi:hypothetical protein